MVSSCLAQGARHEYRPDYLIRLRCKDGKEANVILEVKGFETEQDRQKEVAARRWVRASNHHGELAAGSSWCAKTLEV